MHVLKLHLRNLQRVQTWQSEKGVSSASIYWWLGWAGLGEISWIRVGLITYRSCEVKQGEGGGLFWDEWIYDKTAQKLLLLHKLMWQK